MRKYLVLIESVVLTLLALILAACSIPGSDVAPAHLKPARADGNRS